MTCKVQLQGRLAAKVCQVQLRSADRPRSRILEAEVDINIKDGEEE